MNSPSHIAFWHGFAKHGASVLTAFAMVALARHCFCAGQWQSGYGLRRRRCYPSPSLRSGPSQAGPTLMGRPGAADCAGGVKYCFESCDIAVESAAITTNLRGSIQCASRLSSLPFFPPRLPVACRTRRRAAWPVRLQALLSPTRLMKTSSPVRRLAVLPVLQPAASKSAFRPATRATEPLTDLAAFGRHRPTTRTIRDRLPGGPFAFA